MSHLQQPLFNPNRKYQHLFFDLDHTIWDFEMNSKETLAELYDQHNLAQKGINDFELFFARYNEHNNRLWDRYHKGFIKQDELKWKRMWLTLLDYKIADEPLSRQLGIEFLNILPNKKNLFPYTFEILDYLTNKQYDLHLITNGFEATQNKKLVNSNLSHYFKEMITSETSNSLKPNKAIFEYAFAKTKACQSSRNVRDKDVVDSIKSASVETCVVLHQFPSETRTISGVITFDFSSRAFDFTQLERELKGCLVVRSERKCIRHRESVKSRYAHYLIRCSNAHRRPLRTASLALSLGHSVFPNTTRLLPKTKKVIGRQYSNVAFD